MKTIIILIVVSSFFSVSTDAREFKGRVLISDSLKPIFMAKVVSENAEAFTDSAGFFCIEPGQFPCTLIITANGFDSKHVEILKPVYQEIYLDSVKTKHEEVIWEDMEIEEYSLADMASVTSYKKSVAAGNSMQAQAMYFIAPPDNVVQLNNTEAFTEFESSGFKQTLNNPLSTFSSDVDAASYSIMRRYINDGMKPPTSSVRVEEMINYFKYNYNYPKGNEPISTIIDISDNPWNNNSKIIRIGLQTKKIETQKLPASNFVFLIDVSGSMSDLDKLPLAVSTLAAFVKTLRADDRIAIVTYAGSTRVALPSTSLKDQQKILNVLKHLQSGGSTAGAAGIELAYAEAEKGFVKEGNNRIILVTDGDFNVGLSSVDALTELIKTKRDNGIYISVLGFGKGNIKDDRMEAIADNGNGNYGYIDSFKEGYKILMKEFASNMFTVAKDVKIQVEFNPALVESYRLIGYENRHLNDEDFNNDKKDAGEMGADQQVTALYEVYLKGHDGEPVVDPLRYAKESASNEKFSDELASVKVRYKNPDSEKSNLLVSRLKKAGYVNDNTDMQFAIAVAMFGQFLRGSDYLKKGDFSTIANIAVKNKGMDDEGYRSEFVRLVELYALL